MNLEQLLEHWDGEEVLIHQDEITGSSFVIAIHSVRGNRSIGGTRMKRYPDLAEAVRDAQRLAGGMSLKWAAAGIEAGGAKAVISVPEPLEDEGREALLVRFGQQLHAQGGRFLTGPDLGTSSEDMDIIARAAPDYVFGRTQEAGGAGDPAPFTAKGVFTAMQVVGKRLFGPGGLAGLRVLLQGMGHVAQQLVALLQDEGATVMFSDIDPEVVRTFVGKGLQFVPTDSIYATPCEIFAPCAIGGTINEQTIEHLQCAAVVGGANNQLGEPADAERLRERGILYAPDFVANSGGAIGLIGLETGNYNRSEAMAAVVAGVTSNLTAILDEADQAGCSPETAARRLAQQRIAS